MKSIRTRPVSLKELSEISKNYQKREILLRLRRQIEQLIECLQS